MCLSADGPATQRTTDSPVTRYDQIEHAALTDVGVRRSHNQDSLTVLLASDQDGWQATGHVFHVADGMGAHAVGELASEIATRTVAHTFNKHVQAGVVSALRQAFVEANATIHDKGTRNPEFQGMGTTSTALILRVEGAWIGHVGDSRAYRIRRGKVQQLSFDHSLVWEKARRKHVRPEDLQGVPTNVIIRSLGPEPDVEVDIQGPHPIEDGDTFLLCSDGLSGPLTDRELGAVAMVLPPKEAVQFLIDLANLRGGPDNITVIVVRCHIKGGKKAKSAGLKKKSKPLLQRVPWPMWILLLGLLMAGAAFGLGFYKLQGVGIAFIAAVVAIVIGLVCLGIYHVQSKNQPETEEDEEFEPRNKVYREADCKIDEPLLTRLTQAEETLRTRARDSKWDVDWKRHEKHHGEYEKTRMAQDYNTAFAELCRAMRPLTEALKKTRHKEEAFNPHWEKSEH